MVVAIGGKWFKSKKKLKNYIRGKLKHYYNKEIDDQEFIAILNDLLKNFYQNTVDTSQGIKRFFANYDPHFGNNICLYVELNDNTVKDISIFSCVDNYKIEDTLKARGKQLI